MHVSDMSWMRKVADPSEVVSKGDKVTCMVVAVDQERKRIALGLKQMNNDPWEGDIPGRYKPGEVKKGKVTKLTNFGVFVELEPGLEGLLHVSELADHKVDSPKDVVKVGDEIEVKILRIDMGERKLALSHKRVGQVDDEGGEATAEPGGQGGRQPGRELRGGTGSDSGKVFALPGDEKGVAAEPDRAHGATSDLQ
jgi:small subunit ribosomal protein S1